MPGGRTCNFRRWLHFLCLDCSRRKSLRNPVLLRPHRSPWHRNRFVPLHHKGSPVLHRFPETTVGPFSNDSFGCQSRGRAHRGNKESGRRLRLRTGRCTPGVSCPCRHWRGRDHSHHRAYMRRLSLWRYRFHLKHNRCRRAYRCFRKHRKLQGHPGSGRMHRSRSLRR